MNKKRPTPVFFGLVAALCAVSQAVPADTPKPTPKHAPATIKQLMTLVVEPASNGVFQAAGEPPKSDEAWKTLQGQALTLVEVAKDLASAAHAKDKGEWPKFAKAMQDSSELAFAAAMAKNAKALEDLSDPLYTTCANCHEKYLPK